MKEISIYGGTVALVDDEDYELLTRHRWYLTYNGYAFAKIDDKSVRMHRLIIGTPTGMDTDHIDGNRLNNRRANLRVCTRSQNMMNMRPRKGTSSQFKGVAYNRHNRRWQAYIAKNYRQRTIGYFATELDAARAYNKAATTTFGEFAFLNDIP